MPETELAGQPGSEPERTLEQVIADHPGLATPESQGGKLNDYNPKVLPDDPTAQQWLAQYGGQPAPTPQAQQRETPTEPAQPAPASPERGGLIFGKYKSIEEAERGYREADRRRREVESENIALKGVNLHLEQIFAPMRQQRETPAPPQEIPVQFRGDQPVVPMADFARIAQEQARAAAREEVRNALEPLGKLSAAQTRLTAEFPDFSQRQTEFAQWLASNPTYQERITSDPDSGLDHAYLRFSHEVGAARQAAVAQTTQQARSQVEQARSAASATSSAPGTGVRRGTAQDGQSALVREALKYALETGDWGPYKKRRTEEAVGEAFLNTLDQTQWGR